MEGEQTTEKIRPDNLKKMAEKKRVKKKREPICKRRGPSSSWAVDTRARPQKGTNTAERNSRQLHYTGKQTYP